MSLPSSALRSSLSLSSRLSVKNCILNNLPKPASYTFSFFRQSFNSRNQVTMPPPNALSLSSVDFLQQQSQDSFSLFSKPPVSHIDTVGHSQFFEQFSASQSLFDNSSQKPRIEPLSKPIFSVPTIRKPEPTPFSSEQWSHSEKLFSEIILADQKTPEIKDFSLASFHTLLLNSKEESDVPLVLKAAKIFQKHSVPTTDETSSLFVKAICRCGGAVKCFSAMMNPEVFGITPTRKCFQFLMVKLSLERNVDLVLKAFEVMKSKGIDPSPQSYHVVIRACVDNDRVETAHSFLSQCENEGITVERGTYNVVMNGFMSKQDSSQVLAIYKHMLSREVLPNSGTLMLVTRAFLHQDNVDLALRSFADLVEMHQDLIHDSTQGKKRKEKKSDDVPDTLLSEVVKAVDAQGSQENTAFLSTLLQRNVGVLHCFGR
eukprot:GCRY01000971.1.p1 GENE.GCRY01000971.1~~GCRY01000971.1.p1  ORF type:complete len:430 (+),score=72.98 GCRY01000971.1:91-1380(+)